MKRKTSKLSPDNKTRTIPVPPLPDSVSIGQQRAKANATAVLIAHQTERGMMAFVVAGAEILQGEYGFTPEQVKTWTDKTLKLGGKYLRQAERPKDGGVEARPLRM